MLDGMIDRPFLAAFRLGSGTLTTVNRRQRIAFPVGQAARSIPCVSFPT